MPYYCTVPQCTSLAGRAKDVSFHQFPRDEALAELWNDILKRNKPYTKYSKVCSRHFKSTDYTMTHMGKNKGQWKTLNKDAIPSRNLPRLNADGSVLVLRKTRSPKHAQAQEETAYMNTSNNDVDFDNHGSLVALAKEYLAANCRGASPPPWYSLDQEEDDKDITIVIVKEEHDRTSIADHLGQDMGQGLALPDEFNYNPGMEAYVKLEQDC